MANDRIIEELTDARDAFLNALAGVAPESMTTPGLVGEWSAREVIAHLGYWVGRAVETIHAVEQGRTDQVGQGEPSVEEVNATVARVASQTDLATVRRREAASVEVLIERLRALDPSLLDVRLPDDSTLEASIREDGSDHYREHAVELRRILDAPPRG